MLASNGDGGDNFGHGLGFDGTTLAIGAPYEDSDLSGVTAMPPPNNASQSVGAVYVFR